MTRLRYWIIALIVWLVFFFNIERVISPVNITRYFYILMALITIVALLIPKLRRVRISLLIIIPTLILLALKFWTGDDILGAKLPITLTEIFGIVLSIIFIREISICLSEFEDLIANIAIRYVGNPVDAFDAGQGVMYKELKRAKLYERPLGVMAIKPSQTSLKYQLPKIIEAYKESLTNQMAVASIARALDQELHDSDIIVQQNDILVILLPEADAEALGNIQEKVRTIVAENAGFDLDIGTASYPKDGRTMTFELLLNKAKERLVMKDKEMSQVNSSEKEYVPGL